MGKTIGAVAAALGALLAARQAYAEELWYPHPPGLDEGLEAGAAPSVGVYGIVNQYYGTFKEYGSSGASAGYGVDALFEVPVLFWQTGFKVLGGSYSAAVALPFDFSNIYGTGLAPANNVHGLYNTMVVPGQLAWRLRDNFYVKAGLTINIDDATSSFAHPPNGGGLGSGNGYWTIQPDFGVSWLRDGWNVSLSMHYAINLADADYHIAGGVSKYQSGDVIAGDYTVMKRLGKWKFGVGGYSEDQLTPDTGEGAILAGCAKSNGCKAQSYGAGPLLGYEFGGLSALVEYNFPIASRNGLNGRLLNVRFVIPF